MKKTLLLLSAALSLFAGGAFAAGVIPTGDGISMAQPSAPPVMGSLPLMAAAPPLSERLCPAPSLSPLTYAVEKTLIGTGIAPEPSPVAYDTGDPTDTIKS